MQCLPIYKYIHSTNFILIPQFLCLYSMAWNPFFPRYGCIATFASCEQQNALLLGCRREISQYHRVKSSICKYFFLIFKEGGLESMINQRKIKFIDTKEKGWDKLMTNWLDGFKLFILFYDEFQCLSCVLAVWL